MTDGRAHSSSCNINNRNQFKFIGLSLAATYSRACISEYASEGSIFLERWRLHQINASALQTLGATKTDVKTIPGI